MFILSDFLRLQFRGRIQDILPDLPAQHDHYLLRWLRGESRPRTETHPRSLSLRGQARITISRERLRLPGREEREGRRAVDRPHLLSTCKLKGEKSDWLSVADVYRRLNQC